MYLGIEVKVIEKLKKDQETLYEMARYVIDSYGECNSYTKVDYSLPKIMFIKFSKDIILGYYDSEKNEIIMNDSITVLDIFLDAFISYSTLAAQKVYGCEEIYPSLSNFKPQVQESEKIQNYDGNIFGSFLENEIITKFLINKYEELFLELKGEINDGLIGINWINFDNLSEYLIIISNIKGRYEENVANDDDLNYKLIKLYSEGIFVISTILSNAKILSENIAFINNI